MSAKYEGDRAKMIEEKLAEMWMPKVEELWRYLTPESLNRLRKKGRLCVMPSNDGSGKR